MKRTKQTSPVAAIGDINYNPDKVTRKQAAVQIRHYRKYGKLTKEVIGDSRVYSLRSCRPVIVFA